jgi:hypothetical protein
VPDPLLRRADLGRIALLMATGLALRLAVASGLGLGDDSIYKADLMTILRAGHVLPTPNAYRFVWWLPTTFCCRLFGFTEFAVLLPIVLGSVAGIGVVYALGKELFGEAAAVVAAMLVVVTPIDVAWSTMLTHDVLLSLCSGTAVLLSLRACDAVDPIVKRRRWRAAAVAFWLAFHVKLSGLFLGPALAFLWWTERERIGREFTSFITTSALCFGATVFVSYVFTGDPLAPYHAELTWQGLQGDGVAKGHQLTAELFFTYPRLIFEPDRLGGLVFAIQPHVLLLLAALRGLLGLRSSVLAGVWLLSVFAGLQLNIQHSQGVWVTGFRNIRYLHTCVYPIALLIAGYLVSLRRRFPTASHALLALLLAVGLWQSVAVARPTQIAFRDRRLATRFLATLPPKTVYSDFQIRQSLSLLLDNPPPFFEVESFDVQKRREQLATLAPGYVVTGGAREPYYGCVDCIPRASELDPTKWKLLRELPGPTEPTVWRPEPTRVFEKVVP